MGLKPIASFEISTFLYAFMNSGMSQALYGFNQERGIRLFLP